MDGDDDEEDKVRMGNDDHEKMRIMMMRMIVTI